MRIVVLREIPEQMHEWDDLVRQMGRPEVFYTHEWALAVTRTYQGSITPLLFLGYERGSLVGLVAFATNGAKDGVSFLSANTADYCDFIGPENCRAEFVRLGLEELGRRHLPLPVMANLPADSPTVRSIRALRTLKSLLAFSRPAYECSEVTLRSPALRDRARSAIAADKRLRYSLKSLEKEGHVVVEHLTAWDEIQPALPDFIQAHLTRFASRGGVSHLSDPRRQRFLSELATLLSAKNRLVLSRFMIDGQPIAWNYGFRFQGSWFYYQPTFLSDWSRFSPGICLLSKILEAACNDPSIERVDLGLGAEPYKKKFATGNRQTLHVTMTSSPLRRFQAAARYHLACAVKSNDHLEHWVRRLLGRPAKEAA